PVLAFGFRAELGERIVDTGAEVLVRDIAAAVAHQPPLPGQEPLARQPVQSRQHHPLGEVTGRPEKDKNHRLHCWIRLLRHGRHAPKLRVRPGPARPFIPAEPSPAGSGSTATPTRSSSAPATGSPSSPARPGPSPRELP